MKILLATDAYQPTVNGVVTSTVNLRDELRARGHDVRVLTLGEQDTIDPVNGLYYVSSLSVDRLYPDARVCWRAKSAPVRALIRWQPDLIHTQSEFSTFRMARCVSKWTDAPIVHTYHTAYEDYTHYFSPNREIGRKAVAYFSKKILRHTSSVIVPTPKVAEILHGYGVTEPVHIIPTGLKLDQFDFKLPRREKDVLYRQYGLSPDHLVLVSIGRVAREKNQTEIIRYLARLRPQNISLLIVGDGPYRAELEALVEELGLTDTVRFTGMIDPADVPTYYQLGDAFVCASTSETQGLTYIEALASGLPVLCRRDRVVDDVVIPGSTGYQYDNYDEFRNYLCTLMVDGKRREQMGRAAKKLAFEQYTAAVFANRVEAVYADALARTNKNSYRSPEHPARQPQGASYNELTSATTKLRSGLDEIVTTFRRF